MTDKDTIQMIRKDITERLRDRDNHDCIEAADEIERLRAERDEARREVCNMNETGLRMNESDKKREAKRRGWDCFNTPKAKVDKTLNGVIVDGGKAVSPKYEDIADG